MPSEALYMVHINSLKFTHIHMKRYIRSALHQDDLVKCLVVQRTWDIDMIAVHISRIKI